MEIEYTNSYDLQKSSGFRLQEISSIVLTVLYSIQILVSDRPWQQWQYLLVASLIISLSVGLFAIKKYGNANFLLLPIIVGFISPVLIGAHASAPWVSLGLSTIVLNSAFAALYDANAATILIVATTVLHLVIAKKGYSSITDLQDSNYLHGFFSIIWNAGLPLALVRAKEHYIKTCLKIDEEIESRFINLLGAYKRFTKKNRRDWRNVRLHGTLLNTLISIRNLIQNNQDYSYASEQFANEIKILNDSSSLSEVFENEILNLTKQAEFKNIQFFINGSGNFTNLEEQERILELCREIILNNSKHTDTRIIHIDFKIDDHDSVAIEISTTQKTKNLDSANKSSTVLRLLDLLDVNYELEEITGGLKYRISSIQEIGTGTSLDSIEIFRNTGLQRFANDMVKYSSVICTLTLLGMFFAKVSAFNLLSLAVEVSIINVITFANLSNNIFPAGLSFAAIGLYASFYLHESTCSNNVFLVWTFNVTLTSIFIGILRIKNKYFRWIPLLLFLGTTLVLPSKLPDNCQDLLLGSIPAIFIIPLLVLFLMRFRAKVIINDTNNLLGIYKNAEDLEIIKNLHEMEFNKTLDYSKQVSLELQDNQISEQTLIKRIELAIQVIRNFLICSEQFESESIRIFYNFVGKRLEFGDYTRIELKGEEFGEDFDSTDLAKTLEIIFQFSKGNPLKIHLVKFPQPAIEIVNDAENEELIKKIVDQVNRELIYPIKISQII